MLFFRIEVLESATQSTAVSATIPPFDGRPLVDFPQHPTVIQTKFRLFTRASSSSDLIDDTDIHKLKASNYDGKKKTTFIIHGWLGRDILDIAQRVSLS